MTLTINGQAAEHEAATLSQLVDELGLTEAKVATALNGAFVPARARATTLLSSGDRIEIVAPRQGG